MPRPDSPSWLSFASFRALRNPNFRLFWLGAFVSNVGTWLQSVAQGWLVLKLTGSASWLGLIAFCSMVPSIVFTPIGGVYADRWDRRRMLIVLQIVMLLSAATLGMLVHFKVVAAWHIAVLAVISGTALAFNGPSFSAMIKDLTGGSDLSSGVAMVAGQFHLSRALGPFLAALLLSRVGVAGCFYLNAASFVAVVVALLAVRLEHASPHATTHPSILESMREGMVYVRDEQVTRWLMLLAATLSLLTLPYVTLLPVLAERTYKVGAEELGYLSAATGVGAVIGALASTPLAARFGWIGTALVTAWLSAASLIALGLNTHYAAASWLLGMVGCTNVIAATVGLSTVQSSVPDAFRGRVMSLYNVAFVGSLTVGSLASGALAEAIGARRTILVGGVLFALSLVGFLATRPKLGASPAESKPDGVMDGR